MRIDGARSFLKVPISVHASEYESIKLVGRMHAIGDPGGLSSAPEAITIDIEEEEEEGNQLPPLYHLDDMTRKAAFSR